MMAQSYFPTAAAPVTVLADSVEGEKQLREEDVQEAYREQKDRLLTAIDATTGILSGIRTFNKDEWVVRYPQLKETPAVATSQSMPSLPKRKSMRRSMSFADEPSKETEVLLSNGLSRSITLSSISDAPETEQETDEDVDSEFHVLRLDLKLGANGSSTSASSLVSQLEKSSIANLLDERIQTSLAHIDKLRARVLDTSSKVLVTGDLNAGKSTFVNALLRREVMPVDQQPCTTAFCEVHDAAENNGVEEVHVIVEGSTYSLDDENTFTRHPLSALDDLLAANENYDSSPLLKLYLSAGDSQQGLLSNGTTTLSLIDAPGLNRDSLKTTSLFTHQSSIDVILFLISAENHFTLSSREFLSLASQEKAYIFIVVNKFDGIRNKDKCKRLVLEQIKEMSPRTWEERGDLVHFVDSKRAFEAGDESEDFEELEAALRSFVLVKRSQSKLQPVQTYLNNLLSDVELLSAANRILAQDELARAKGDLEVAKPVLDKMRSSREMLEDSLETVEEQSTSTSAQRTTEILSSALADVREGKAPNGVKLPSYPGLLGIWDYARAVRQTLLTALDGAVKKAEDEARKITSSGVDTVKDFGEKHLPEGVERSRRVFMPEAMFTLPGAAGKGGKKARRTSGIAVGAGVGIGLAQRQDMLETTFLDLFDVNHHLFLHFGPSSESSSTTEDDSSSTTALSLLSVSAGALTMVSGQALGARSIIEGGIRLMDTLASPSTRKYILPVLGAVGVGLSFYVVLELPHSIPRTVGRRIHANVSREEWEAEHASRVSREVRKVLRLASWDLRSRFTSALEDRGKEVALCEELKGKAEKAERWFTDVQTKCSGVREVVNGAKVISV